MRNALIKDCLREIRHSVGRFLSIFLIVGLGCGFFSGIKAVKPDMTDTAKTYFEDNRLMDMKFTSPAGVDSGDVEAVKKADNVLGAHAAYSKDVFYLYRNQNLVLRCMSFDTTSPEDSPNRMNDLVVLEGRLPEREGECAVETKINSPSTFAIGNTITFTEPEEGKPLSDSLAHESYEIVGIVTSPMYIGYERDSTTVGNGSVTSNVFLREEEFTMGHYTDLFVKLDGVQDMDPFSDEYREKVAELGSNAAAVFTERAQSRVGDLKNKLSAQISSAEKQIDISEQFLGMDMQELDRSIEALTRAAAAAQAALDSATEEGRTGLFERSALNKTKDALAIAEELRADNGLTGEAHDKYSALVTDSRAQIAEARETLDLLDQSPVFIYDRFSASDDYSSFDGDSQKIDSISKVFPVFFILVAALVVLTTMTRMIEEQRGMIGIYKALGYSSGSIAAKFLFYCILAAVSGSVLGGILGLKIVPYIIYESYKIMYNIPHLDTPVRWNYIIGCTAVAVVCVCVVVLWSCLNELRSVPGDLLRPKPPKSGKRVLLESFTPVWSRLSFLSKVTLRNLFRYKRRFFMTVVGVVGCTALIITGFGLKHSIKTIVDKQFGDVMLYDATAVLNPVYTYDELDHTLSETEEIGTYLMTDLSESNAVSDDGESQKVYITVPCDPERINDFIALRDISDGERIELPEGKVLITQKLSILFGLSPGDSITLQREDGSEVNAEIAAVTKNYAMHYIFMTPDTYTDLFGEAPEFNVAFMTIQEGVDTDSFKESFISQPEFYGIAFKTDSSKGFLNSFDSLDSVIVLLIVCAGLLAVVVLYNLANINITERYREIATVKVLGFYDRETSDYILRENYISAAVGVLLGCLVGKLLHHFVIITAEVDIVMFNRELVWYAYLLGIAMTLAFTALVNGMLHFKLRRIDMVESLKSVE